jgi:hypothetical protein
VGTPILRIRFLDLSTGGFPRPSDLLDVAD